MRVQRQVGSLLLVITICVLPLGLQAAKSKPALAGYGVPQQIRFTGVLHDGAGAPRAGTAGILFAIYGEQTGGAPLWQETQNVVLDGQGRYAVLLGSARGLPKDIFTSNDARWLGVQVLADAEPEQSRILLVSVPYALKAQDAETLGGRPASAYVLSESLVGAATTKGGGVKTQAAGFNPEGPVQTTTSTTLNAIPKFSGTDTLADSMLLEQYNQPATDAFGHVLSNEDVVRLGDGTGLNKRLEIDGRMVAEGFDVVTALPNSVHVVNNYIHGVGFQGNANGLGFSTGFAGTSRGLNGAGVRAFSLPPLSLQPQAPGDYTYGVLTSNYHPQGAGVAALSSYNGTVDGDDFPTLTEAIGLYAAAANTGSISAVIDQRTVGGGKILSARALGTEVISMTSAGNITASGTVTANAFSGDGSGLSNVTGVGSLASDPAPCSANNFVTDIAANGTLTCAQPSSSNLSDGASLATQTFVNAGDSALAAPQYVTLASSATLANERTLTAGKGIAITDGGAGSTVTIDNKAEFAQTSIQGGDTLTAAGSFASNYVIPANTLAVGTVIEVWAAGTTSWTGGSTGAFTFGVKLGSTTALPEITVGQNSSAQINRMWRLQARLICTSTGASGTLESQGDVIAWPFSGAYSVIPSLSLASITIDTTTSQTLSVFEGVTNATAQSVTMRQLIVKILK